MIHSLLEIVLKAARHLRYPPRWEAWGLWVWAGIMVGAFGIAWMGYRVQPDKWRRWLDVYLLAILGGLVGARLGYVLIHLEPFVHEPGHLLRLWFGEYAWQGALVGGGISMAVGCRRWQIPLDRFLDGMALALPVLFVAVERGCRSAGCGSGVPVDFAAERPVWLAGYLPNSAGLIMPLVEVQTFGILAGSLILAMVGWLTLNDRLAGRRFWPVSVLLALALLPSVLWGADSDYPLLDLLSISIAASVGFAGWRWSAKRGQSAVSDSIHDRL